MSNIKHTRIMENDYPYCFQKTPIPAIHCLSKSIIMAYRQKILRGEGSIFPANMHSIWESVLLPCLIILAGFGFPVWMSSPTSQPILFLFGQSLQKWQFAAEFLAIRCIFPITRLFGIGRSPFRFPPIWLL